MTVVLWLLVGLVLVGVVTLVATRIRRLDRLHVRTDAARDGLEAALERRAAAAVAVAAVLRRDRADAVTRAVAATRQARATGTDREAAENLLGRALAALDRSRLPDAVLEELVDAEQLVVLARRVHNDAVRDTRGLRSRRLVRWLHLAGTAPMPEYFEIADAEAGVTTAAPVRRRLAPPA
ncbi:NUDIX hydrolase [Pseudonocardia kunmingensis]|uniref:NUDIX hydrolase n=1 Tax=Pseudonocardia kunmingensis TaxID=630975 RepID=A0A543D4A8_9PSEU|nr:NUDIX hydrolase [Pseudonocardia kunmingensis]TQM04170.1 hypothetical protein FB558_7201 [Pseudonocardia kunmingensis]